MAALPTIDGHVELADGVPVLHSSIAGRPQYDEPLQPQVADRWAGALRTSRVGFVHRRPGLPTTSSRFDAYVCVGDVAIVLAQDRNVRDVEHLVDQLLALGCERLVSVTHEEAMAALAERQLVLLGGGSWPRSGGRSRRRFHAYVATTAPATDDPPAVVPLDVEFLVHHGRAPLRVVGVIDDGATAVARFEAVGYLAFAAPTPAELYREAGRRLTAV
jgi:hypothetical protein